MIQHITYNKFVLKTNNKVKNWRKNQVIRKYNLSVRIEDATAKKKKSSYQELKHLEKLVSILQ